MKSVLILVLYCLDSKTCENCNVANCAKCKNKDPSICIECFNGFNLINDDCIQCTESQFYNISSKSCQDCISNCKHCTSENLCTVCNENYELKNDKTCSECLNSQFYNQSLGICQNCPVGCSSCTSLDNCSHCKENYEHDNFSSCIPCLASQFYSAKSKSCENCPILCQSCKSSEKCLSCSPNYELKNGSCLSCPDSKFYHPLTKTCKDCPSSCTSCLSFTNCMTCKENFELLSNKSCICKKEFKLNQTSCIRIHFKAYLSIIFNNSLIIKFDDNLNSTLSSTNLIIKLNESIVGFKIIELSLSAYLIELNKDLNFIEELFVKVEFFDEVYSEQNYLLENKTLTGKLFKYSENYEESLTVKETKEIVKYGKSVAIASGSIGVASGIIGMNPLGFFNLLNLIEIFIYSLLFDFEFSSEILEFVDDLKVKTKIPNFFPTLLKSSEDLPQKYKNFGIVTSYFTINFANSIIILVILILLFFSSKVLLRFKNIKLQNLGQSLQSKLIFSYFLRFLIQSSFDLSLFSMLSLRFSKTSEYLSSLDKSFSCIILVLFI